MGRKKVTIHTPRNIDLPAHVVMIPASSDSGSSSVSSSGNLKKSEKNGGKKCLCLASWLTGLLLLCVGVIVIAHYLTSPMGPSVGSSSSESLLIQADQTERQVLSCQDSSTTPLDEKIHQSDLILTAKLQRKAGLDLFRVERVDQVALKGGAVSGHGDFWLKINSSSPCHESFSVATASNAPQVLFLRRVGKGGPAASKGAPLYAPRFHPLPSSAKLVELMRKILDSQKEESKAFSNNEVPHGNEGKTKKHGKDKKVTKAGIDVGLLDNKHSEKQCRCNDGSERPVCGSDHVTYKNKCSLQKASCVKENNITLISERPCEDSDLCGQGGCPFYGLCLRDPEIGFYECHCQGCTPEDEDPVCGNDDVTYANQCELESESCRNQRPIKRAYKGKCKKDLCEGVVCQQGSHCDSGRCVCPTECQEDYKPVCGSDGHTHHNTCLMQKRSCENGEIKRKVIEVVHGGPCVHPKTKCDFQEEGSIGRGGKCKCPKGSTGSNCQDCSPGYWAYTSFGCTACNCHALGTAKAACDQVTGECVCKPGYSGKNCQVCPDKTMADQTSCSSSTTKYLNPIRCGQTEMCDFGATCSQSSGSCVCEVDCLKYGKSQQPVCGSDGNTYRSECQLRQYSCRIQKEVIIVSRQPCNDAPLSIYGVDGSDVLADGEGGGDGGGRVISSIALYGMLGDVCVDDRDCFVENSVCSGDSDNLRKCGCKKNFQAAADNNAMCSEVAVNRCDPNPCQNGGSCEEHDGTFSCYCQQNFAGSHCQLDMTATSDTNLEASFAGNAHVKARATEDIVSRLEVELSFRTFSNDGLLVYGGSGGSGTDYFSIKLEDGHLVFEYELGGGPVVLKSAARVTLGEWTEIKAKRYHQDGLLEVGPHHARVTGSAKGSLRTLNIPNVIWIGGLDLESSRESVEGASISRNFVGCMKNVKIGRTPLILNGNEQHGQDDVLERKNVQRCGDNPCSRMPCANEGFCSADTGTVGAFQCQCRKEFTGRHCEKPRNECHPNPCLNRGKCHLKYQGFHCQCKDGFYGRVCEKGAQAGSGQEGTRFKKSMPLDDKQKVTFGLKVNLSSALTAATDGGERLQTSEESRSWMFKVPTLSLEEGDGAVQFSLSAENQLSVSCHQTNVTLLADLRVSDGNWHQVTVVRTSQNLSLVVDKSVRATAPLHQPFSFLDKPLILNSLGTADYYCLKNFHLVSWRQGRKRRTESSDICR